MRTLWVLAILMSAVALVPVSCHVLNRVQASQLAAKESTFVGALHVGQSRADLYRVARSVGAEPLHASEVRRDAHGLPLPPTAFPQPSASDPHPPVVLYFDRGDGLFLWHVDRINVRFEEDDRVTHWTIDRYQSGS
jgi:hypothetical protein